MEPALVVEEMTNKLTIAHIAPASKIDQEFYERVLRNMKERDRKRAEKNFGRKADKNDKNNRA